MIADKSITELRGIAQALSVPDLFQLDRNALLQAIELRQAKYTEIPKIEIQMPQYDVRLMTASPSSMCNITELEELLKPYVARGLKIKFDEERWYMSLGKKSDEGSLRMPLRVALKCAEALLE